MKHLFFLLILSPLLVLGTDPKLPSEIKEVTVYLKGAEITRTALCHLKPGTSEVILTGLSTKIDESSIQISGLRSVSILSVAYDINYIPKMVNTSESVPLQAQIDEIDAKVAHLKNTIAGLEEEAQVIYTNRTIGTRLRALELEKIKEISTYFRERITAIKNAIFKSNLEINQLTETSRSIKKQLAELNHLPEKEQGEIKIKFDAPVATDLNLHISYHVRDAGWVPNYDIKSKGIDAPLELSYKAHVYQKTGKDWNDVDITLSTGNPNLNMNRPELGSKYLNFTRGHSRANRPKVAKKQHYVHNPSVKRISGTVSDESGAPLPGANVMVKGSGRGVQTDFDGHFLLEVGNGEELKVSYLGFHTEEIPIYSSVMNIRLNEDTQTLDEVVVVGFGTSSKKSITGAVGSVSNGQHLAGRVAGISVAKGSRPEPPQLPIYIIDGVPADDFVEGDLDESEIASREVLKGTRATSIYGARAAAGVVVITTKKSSPQDDVANTKFIIKKRYSIASDGDITAIEINAYTLAAQYEYFAAPIINENVFLTTVFKDWEKYNLLPGEASIYFKGAFAGKTTLDPYTTKKEMTVSLGIDPNITVVRKQNRNFKSKSFMGNSRILNRIYDIEIKNNKNTAIDLKLLDRIPISQNKEIKLDDVETYDAEFDKKKGLLSWKIGLSSKETKTKTFSFRVRYPRYRTISL